MAPADDEGTGEPPSPPSIEVLVAELEVSAAEVEDITLAVADVRSDTRVEVDGQAWLPAGAAPAHVEDEQLRIFLGGAMVVGTHELALFHEAGGEQLRSDPLRLDIVAASPGPPSAELYPDVLGVGDRLIAHGQGPRAALGLIDELAPSMVVRAGQWSAEGFALELPGLAPGGGVDLAIVEDVGAAHARWVVAIWLAAGEREVRARIAPVNGLGEPSAEPGEVLQLWSLDDPQQVASLGPHELARVDDVALLGRTAVIAVEARRDAEMPTLGDHLLVTRWLAADGEPAPPVLLRGPDARDLDRIADARLWTYAGHEEALGVRVALGFPWLLTIASNGLPVLVDDPGEQLAVPVSSTSMVVGEGAFGSRHVFAFDETAAIPQIRALRLNRWSTPNDPGGDGDGGDPVEPVDLVELPAWPTGAPSLALLDGSPTLLVPLGPDTDAVVVRSTGAVAELVTVADLRCDEVALAGPGFDGIGDTLPLACLLGAELRRGVLRVD